MVLSIAGITAFSSSNNKANNFNQNNSNNNRKLAIYLENDSGKYELSSDRKFPKDGYVLDTEKTTCKNGGTITQDPTTKSINGSFSKADSCNLYFKKEPIPLLPLLLSKTNNSSVTDYNSGVKTEMYTFTHPEATQTTGWSEEERTDYRYIGNTPNNYVTFNDETWRIIGVFTVENESGTKEQRIKIIRGAFLGNMTWDNKSDNTYTNEWPTSILSTMLNGDYINKGSSFDYTWYYEAASPGDNGPAVPEDPDIPIIDPDEPEIELGISYTAKSPAIKMLSASSNKTTIKGLNPTAQNQISSVKWYLGGNKYYSGLGAPDYYSNERETTVYSGRSTNVIAKVGLIYPSDYVYTYALGVDNTCYSDGYNCDKGTPSTGWLFNSNSQWTLTPSSSVAYSAFQVYTAGFVSNLNVSNYGGVRPSLYLRSDIKITSGDGSSGNPYKLKAVE